RFFLLIAVVGLLALAAYAGREQPPPDAIESPEIAKALALAAQRFNDTLVPGMQAKYLFQDAERGNFHFFPVSRRGVPLKQLKEGQRQLEYALMSAAAPTSGASAWNSRIRTWRVSIGQAPRRSISSPQQFRFYSTAASVRVH